MTRFRLDDRIWLRLAVSTLIDLSTYLMTELDTQSASEDRILSGMADMLKEYSADRQKQMGDLFRAQTSLEHRISHLAIQVETMRLQQAGNLERLSDRMYERNDLSDGRYREYSMRIQDAEARLQHVETEIADIKRLLDDLTSDQSKEAPVGSDRAD